MRPQHEDVRRAAVQLARWLTSERPSLEIIKRNNWEKPTPIQAQAIPAIMSGRDVIGIAKTGSGKTLAFVLPMLRHILDQRLVADGEGPIGLILTPTRELAVQTYTVCKQFTKPLKIRVRAQDGRRRHASLTRPLPSWCVRTAAPPSRTRSPI